MMDQVSSESLEYIESRIIKLIESDVLDQRTELIIRLRFGIETEKVTELKEMARLLKTSMKNAKREIEKAEKKVFNLLKNKI